MSLVLVDISVFYFWDRLLRIPVCYVMFFSSGCWIFRSRVILFPLLVFISSIGLVPWDAYTFSCYVTPRAG